LKESRVYFYQLHTSITRSRIGRQQGALLTCGKAL